MAPKKSNSVSPPKTDSSASNHSMSLDASQSQEIDTKAVEEQLKDQRLQYKQRKQARRDECLRTHEARVSELKRVVDQAYAKHDENMKGWRKSKLERFTQLVSDKKKLEDQLGKCEEDLEEIYERMAEKVQIAVDARLGLWQE